jgi:hypothetical protein
MKMLMKKIPLLATACLVTVAAATSANATIIVSWGPGDDILSGGDSVRQDLPNRSQLNGNFGIGDPNVDDRVNYNLFSNTTLLSPFYSGPVSAYGNTPASPEFRIAGAMYEEDGAPEGGPTNTASWRWRVRNNALGGNDAIMAESGSSGSTYGVYAIWWDNSNFVGSFQNSNVDLSAFPVGSVSATATVNRDGVRLMIQNDGQWYISDAASSSGQLSVDFDSAAWLAYNPDTTHTSLWASGSVGTPASGFSATPDFDKVSAIGVYWERIDDNSTREFLMSEFTVVPEPSTYAIWAGMLALGIVALRSRLR